MKLALGANFAGYRIDQVLGSGGMGTVYLARHPRLPRLDAVKVLDANSSDDPSYRTGFLREAEVAARLRHPNLVAVHDRGECDGLLWIAMQYVPGSDLSAAIRNGETVRDLARCVRILGEVAAGLDELHRAGLLHRDVKPANVLIAAEPGRPERVLVTDFGIARRVDDYTTQSDAGFTGTLAYAAPEQLDVGALDHRVDVYSLGGTLVHMLTGALPFTRPSAAQLVYAHLYEPPPRPSVLNPAVPGAFDAVIAKAMAKDPRDRYATCGELATAAAAAMRNTAAAPTRTAAGVRVSWLTRVASRIWQAGRRGVVVLAALIVVLLLSVIAILAMRPGSDDIRTAPNPPRTGTIEPAEWGNYAFMAQALVDLLPPTPFGTGYQDVSGCSPIDENGTTISLDTQPALARLYCVGNSDPVYSMFVDCNADRSPIGPEFPLAQAEGSERWSRASGSGTLFWGSGIMPGPADELLGNRQIGTLNVYFDDPGRNFCRLQVYSRTVGGSDLRTRWWADAPL